MRVQWRIKRFGRQFQQLDGLCKAGVIHIEAELRGAHALVQSGLDPVGLEDLLDGLALVGVQVEAVRFGSRGEHRLFFAGGAGRLLVEGPGLAGQGLVAQLVQVLSDLGAVRVEFEGLRQRGSAGRRVAHQPILGRGLDQRSDRVIAGHFGSQRVVGIGGVEPGCLFIAAQGLFKLLGDKKLAGCKEELGGTPAISAAGRLGALDRRGSAGLVLAIGSALSGSR